MIKYLTIIIATLALVTNAKAQVITQDMQQGLGLGVRTGLNLSDLTGSSGSVKPGLKVGVFTDYYFNHKFGLELGLYYNQLGSINIIEPGTTDGKSDCLLHYANINLSAKYHVARGFRVFLGGQAGYNIAADARRILNDGSKEYLKISSVNRYEGAAVLGVGYTFKFGLDVEASYTRGFTSVFNNNKQFNSTYALSVGWRFIGHGGRARGRK